MDPGTRETKKASVAKPRKKKPPAHYPPVMRVPGTPYVLTTLPHTPEGKWCESVFADGLRV